MPTQSRPAPLRRLAGVASILAAALLLSACAAALPQHVAAAAAGAERLDSAEHVVDDARTRSVLVVPAHPIGALAVFLHGWSQNRRAILETKRDVLITRELAAHGYLVLSADADGKAWGDAASVADYQRLIAGVVKAHAVRDVYLMGESMGGLATMQLAARVPDVRAAVAWYPVCDLRTMTEPHFQPTIRAAWAGADRAAVSPVPVPPVPLLVWASTHDTVVRATANAAVCVAEDRAAGGTATWFHTTGNHGDLSNFHPDQVLAFFDAHRTTASGVIRTAPAGSRPPSRS